MNASSPWIKSRSIKPPYIQMWASQRRKSFCINHFCRSTSRTKTLSNMRILELNTVDTIPRAAAEIRVDVEKPAASGPILYRNQFDTL